MVLTKTLLTEILLEVTNEEIQSVAKETRRKATKGLLSSPRTHASSVPVYKTWCFSLKRIHDMLHKPLFNYAL